MLQAMQGQYNSSSSNQMSNYNNNQSSNHYMQQHPSQNSGQQSHHLQNFLQQPAGTTPSQHSPSQQSQPAPPQPSPGQSMTISQRVETSNASGCNNGPEHRKEQTSHLGAMLSSPEAQNASDSQHSISQVSTS